MKKILVVEDNEMNLQICKTILTHGGYEVITAADGIEGIEKASTLLPDIILMDIQMPVMDGENAMKRIKESSALQEIPIIAITSYAMAGDRERFLSEGFIDYVSKPISVNELLSVVKKY